MANHVAPGHADEEPRVGVVGHARRRAPKPVFLDRSGRRRRLMLIASSAAGVILILALGTLVAGLFGASPLPLPGLPNLGGGPAPGAVPTESSPAQTTSSGVVPVGATSASESASPSSPRHVPTQTPSHGPQSSKTK